MPAHLSTAQFLLFASSGCAGTIAHYAILLLSVEVLAVHPVSASVLGYLTGGLINFILSHHIVFKSTAVVLQTAPRFFLVAIIGLMLNWFLMWSLVEQLGAQYLLAQIVATLLILGCNYLANAMWTFGRQRGGE